MSNERFSYTNNSDPDNEISCKVINGTMRIAVSDEKAVDSYNAVFECEIFLNSENAKKLRDYLLKEYPL